MFTRGITPYRIDQKYEPFYLHFVFLHPTQMDVKNPKQMNLTRSYTPFTNIFLSSIIFTEWIPWSTSILAFNAQRWNTHHHIISTSTFAKAPSTKTTSCFRQFMRTQIDWYLSLSDICNAHRKKTRSACTDPPSTCSTGTGYRTSRRIPNHHPRKHSSWCRHTATQTCVHETSPPASHEKKIFWNSSGTLKTGPLTLSSSFGRRLQSYHMGFTVPQNSQIHCSAPHKPKFSFCFFLFQFLCLPCLYYNLILSSLPQLKIRISFFFFSPVGAYSASIKLHWKFKGLGSSEGKLVNQIGKPCTRWR